MKKKSSTIVNDTDDDDVPEINVAGVDMPEISSQSNTINSTQQQQLEIFEYITPDCGCASLT